jgi:hypothetical protein
MDSNALTQRRRHQPSITFSVAVNNVPNVNSRTVTVTVSGADLANIAGNLNELINHWPFQTARRLFGELRLASETYPRQESSAPFIRSASELHRGCKVDHKSPRSSRRSAVKSYKRLPRKS